MNTQHGFPQDRPEETQTSPQASSQNPNQTPYQPFYPSKPKPVYTGRDALFAWLSVAVCYLLILTVPVSSYPMGGMLFLLLLFTFGGIFLTVNKVVLPWRSYPLVGVALLLSLSLITGGNRGVRGLMFLFLLLFFLYWASRSAGFCGKGLFDPALFSHAFRAVVIRPFGSLFHIFPALFAFRANKEGKSRVGRTFLLILAGLVIAVIPTVAVAVLLSYDPSFNRMMEKLFSFSPGNFFEFFWKLILAFIVALPLFGTLYSVSRGDPADSEKAAYGKGTHVLPKALLCAAVTPVLLLYVAFFVSQWKYYVSAFTKVLPEGLVYSEYARSGFFELCTVCAINAGMLLLFNILMKKSNSGREPLKRIYSAVICLFSLVLVATALSKMLLYINTYGLTQKRVYASWFMLVLAVAFLLVLVAQVFRKFALPSALAISFLLLLSIIALPDVDARIADYNVSAYRDGLLPTVDVAALEDLGNSAVPALVRLEKHVDEYGAPEKQPELAAELDRALLCLESRLSEQPSGFFSFSIPAMNAWQSLKLRADEPFIIP